MGYQNFFATKLYTDIGASDNVIALETMPTETSGRLVLEARNPTQREVIKYTGIAGNTITGVTRGHGGTTAKSHLKNSLVEMNLTAGDIQDLYDAFNSFAAANNDWRTLVGVPSTVTNWGNRSSEVLISGDVTSLLSEGMRVRIPRTVTPGTQSTFLNGTNQYWNDTSVSGMTFTDDFVTGAWVYITSHATNNTIISRFNGTSGFTLRTLAGDGTVQVLIYNAGAGNYSRVLGSQSIPLNKWTHVAVQMDASAFTTTPTTSYIMIDGVDTPASVNRAGTNPTSLVQAGNLEVGSRQGGTENFSGYLKNVFVSSAKITQANVRSFMNADITPAVVAAHNIVSAYNFNGNGNDVNTTNANNLTAQNGAVATNTNVNFKPYDYGIVTKVELSGADTKVTLFSPQGTGIPNETLGTISYSSADTPHGFPRDKSLWTVYMYNLLDSPVSGAAQNVWYNNGNLRLNVPIGKWNVGWKSTIHSQNNAGSTGDNFFSLSSSATAETDKALTVLSSHASNVATIAQLVPAYAQSSLTADTATNLYPICRTTSATAAGRYMSFRGDLGMTVVFAECTYV